MDDRTQGALLLAVGGICLRLGLTDVALAYVKSAMQIPLVLTGIALLVLGVGSILRGFREDAHEADGHVVATGDLASTDHAALHGLASEFGEGEALAEQAHDHAHGPAVAWFLVLPLLALLLVAPPALGSFAAERQSARPPVTTQTSYPPLRAAEDGAVPLTMSEFVFRALYDEEASLSGARLRLSGFVTPAPEDDGYLLTRFAMSCCAADARAITVRIIGDVPREADTWLEVEGTWDPEVQAMLEPGELAEHAPVLRADAVREIPEPVPPYEY